MLKMSFSSDKFHFLSTSKTELPEDRRLLAVLNNFLDFFKDEFHFAAHGQPIKYGIRRGKREVQAIYTPN